MTDRVGMEQIRSELRSVADSVVRERRKKLPRPPAPLPRKKKAPPT